MRFFLFVAFISGMAVTVVELAAARLLAPYFGASLFVWTNVIGVILFGLTLGYFIGGRLADRAGDPRYIFSIIGAAGVFIFLVPFLVKAIAPLALVEGIFTRTVPLVLVIGSFIASTFLFLLPALLLGMTSPFLIRIASKDHANRVGTIAGRIFGWSTVGSILGVFCTGLFFIPFFGTRATLFGTAALLLTLALFGTVRLRAPFGTLLLLLFMVGAFVDFGPLRKSSSLLFETESPYQYIRVEEIGESRYLIFNEGNGAQSVWHRNTLTTGFYYDYLASLPLFFPKEQTLRILLVGLGGGTIPKQYDALYANRPYIIDAVEIDPAVVDVARRWFDLPETNLRLHVADGRTFLAHTKERYDLIILDAFAQQYYIPWYMTTQEFFTLVQSRLSRHGLVAFNVAASRPSSPLLVAIGETVQSVFSNVATIPMPHSWNTIVLARNESIVLDSIVTPRNPFLAESVAYLQTHAQMRERSAATILTDDRAPIEMMTDAMFLTESLLSI